MSRFTPFLRFSFLTIIWLLSRCLPALAADGFDNNYVGGDANQLFVTIDGLNQAILFGPGLMSVGSFFIDVPNGTTNNQGPVSSFVISGATSFLRSAYFDRVVSSALYYRVYPVSSSPPGWSTLALNPSSSLIPGTCYTETQNNTWQITQSINVVQGLANGNYVLEFYAQSELYDVGIEDGTCAINALEQCNTSQVHTGRYISSRFNTTDPAACTISDVIANQSPPTKILFQLINSPLPVDLRYFRGMAEGDQVRLQWGTAQEQGLEDFLIERSGNGYQWFPLDEVPAAGTSTMPQDYTLVDRQPVRGPNYYRLKARSSNGHLDISSAITVTIAGSGLTVWPNPVRETLHYALAENRNETLTLRLFKPNGQVLTEQTADPAAFSPLSVESLDEGLYFLEIYDASGYRLGITRFVKLR